MTGVPDVIGVVGAGTMGGGIAQLAAMAGARTLVFDPVEGATAKGLDKVRANLAKGAARGRWTEEDADAAGSALEIAESLEALAPCGLIIEAAPERLEVKQELFAALEAVVTDDCVLASNTSSLLVTAIAATAQRPERVVGMHFFNPPPLMRLLEVVAGEDSGEPALAVATATGEAMGKVVIRAADGPGFIANRANRPFNLEALKLLQEQAAALETIDRIFRLEGGFRMGPFELMDLVGVDVGFAVAESFFAQSYGEPRWRPSMIAARMVASGRHGRKSGRGYYDYTDGPHRPDDPEPPAAGGGDGALVVIAGDTPLAAELTVAAAAAGWDARDPESAEGEVPALIVDCGALPEDPPLQGGPLLVCCARGSLQALDPEGTAAGFHVLPPLETVKLAELTRSDSTSPAAAAAAERFFASLGMLTVWVGDFPGLVLGRVVCQIVNEAAFCAGEGVGSAADIDAGLVHGLNHPRGALAWADVIGLDHVLDVLEALQAELGEERYRPAPLLRRHVAAGRLGVQTGAGFHVYDDVG